MTSKNYKRILFITWDSPDTSYLEGLFLPIFQRLRAHGYQFHVLQFTWGNGARQIDREARCRSAGIPYRRVTIARHPRAAGSLLTALLGARHIRKAAHDWHIDTLMPRSLMPALAVLRISRTERTKYSIVFDADGLAVDERVDFDGLSSHGMRYRFLRDIEAEMLRCADVVVTRTEAARTILQARAGAGMQPNRYHLVSNGIDPEPFTTAFNEHSRGEKQTFDLCYCGSLGTQYRLADMLVVAQTLREKIEGFRFNIFTRSHVELSNELTLKGLSDAEWIVTRALSPEQVPTTLSQCDVGIALRLPLFSTQAVLPIKLGEYLLSGLPIVGTPGVGNSEVLQHEGVFHSAECGSLDAMVNWVCDVVRPQRSSLRQKCHTVGLRYYSVSQAVENYASALSSVTPRAPPS